MQDSPLQIRVGIAAMDKKVKSVPMKEILGRLAAFGDIKCIPFGDEILQQSEKEWPQVHCLISFFSTGFPLEKAQRYARGEGSVRSCFSVNDLDMQSVLLDRWEVNKLLSVNSIPTPFHLLVDRRPGAPPLSLVESLDYIEVNGIRINKPFVEKPLSGEDHNIYIYYHSSQGGGSRRLFRKVKNSSSKEYPEISSIRSEGSFIYEEYIPTGRDIKVYTVGPSFAFAESRKAPTVDGIVQRNALGKEIRRGEMLTDDEAKIASAVCSTFKQNICGFDLLRLTQGDSVRSYVIDVNGWSFVKGNPIYYSKCAVILREMFLNSRIARELAMQRVIEKPLPELYSLVDNRNFDILLGTVCIFRHADRTPKQKFKIVLSHPEIFEFIPDTSKEFKIGPSTTRLKEFTKVINTLCQSSDCKDLNCLRNLLNSQQDLRVQLKPKLDKCKSSLESVHIIVKWGGKITSVGIEQSRRYGELFRKYFFHLEDEECVSSMLENPVVFVSDEERVRVTAERFCEGLLKRKFSSDVEEHSFLSDKVIDSDFLDDTSAAKKAMGEAKDTLSKLLNGEIEVDLLEKNADIRSSLSAIGQPLSQKLFECNKLIMGLIQELKDSNEFTSGDIQVIEMMNRWKKLQKEFINSDQSYNISKICDIYDCIMYECIHHSQVLSKESYFFRNNCLSSLLECSSKLASIVIPNEYGIGHPSKLEIGRLVAKDLFSSINVQLKSFLSSNAKSRCSFYFTSETQINAVRNILSACNIACNPVVESLLSRMSLHYMSHCTFQLYGNARAAQTVEEQSFQFNQNDCYLRISFSPGAAENPLVACSHSHNIVLPVMLPTPISGNISLPDYFTKLSCI